MLENVPDTSPVPSNPPPGSPSTIHRRITEKEKIGSELFRNRRKSFSAEAGSDSREIASRSDGPGHLPWKGIRNRGTMKADNEREVEALREALQQQKTAQVALLTSTQAKLAKMQQQLGKAEREKESLRTKSQVNASSHPYCAELIFLRAGH